MSLSGIALSIINTFWGRLFGAHLRPHPIGKSDEEDRNSPLLDHALRRLRNPEIASLIDVGAARGYWSRVFARHFPDRHHLLVDANKIHLSKLSKICQDNPNWHFALTAVGAVQGELYFDGSDPLGGHLAVSPLNENYLPCHPRGGNSHPGWCSENTKANQFNRH
jgi:hypothetical protein